MTNKQRNSLKKYLRAHKCPYMFMSAPTVMKHLRRAMECLETHESCDACNSPHITRVPATFTNLAKDTPVRKKAVGETTTEFIENSRADLRAQKQELEKKR